MTGEEGNGALRNRVKELRYLRAGDLLGHPLNPRRHPAHQKAALEDSLSALGIADALLAYETDGGEIRLFDGHLRKLRDPEQVWPVLITDLTEPEARLAIQIVDPLAALAETDEAMLAQLRALTEQDCLDGLIAPGPGLEALLGREGAPEFQPAGEETQGRLDEKSRVICPRCGCEFSPL